MRYDAVIFDQDGTVYLGDALITGAMETIAILRRHGVRTFFLSNNPTRTREEYAAKLAHLGIPTPVSDIVNSSFVMVRWLLRHAPSARLFVIGEAPLCGELREAGFVLTDAAAETDIVVASFDRTFDYAKLQIAFDAINNGARLVATNPDRYCPVPGGGQPDCAAIIAAIEACTGATCEVVVGKPSPIMVDTVIDMLRVPPAACLVVGDRLETDIQMGVHAGMDTCLVLTGTTTPAILAASPIQPSLVLADISVLPTALGLV